MRRRYGVILAAAFAAGWAGAYAVYRWASRGIDQAIRSAW